MKKKMKPMTREELERDLEKLIDTKLELYERIQEEERRADRYYAFILGIRNLMDALPEFEPEE